MKPFDIENNDKINSGFKVPEDYFELFEEKIMNQIEEKNVKVISIFRRKKTWLIAVAAVFIVGLFTNIYLSNSKIEIPKNDDYLAFENTITNEDIIENLSDNDIIEIEKSLNIYDQETKNYAKEYLN